VVVGAEALWRGGRPDVFLDTMGYAFTYPLAWLCGAEVACYTHYPTISSDMLQRVYERRPAYNNDALVSGSVINSRAKYAYYVAFCAAYRLAGAFARAVAVNSSWTRNHIEQLWRCKPVVVFPPCDVREFARAAAPRRRRAVVSLGQFRPEKDHRLQIAAMALLAARRRQRGLPDDSLPPLLVFGSCRDSEDQALLDGLRAFAHAQGVAHRVQFRVNEPFAVLKHEMGHALLGIHTMWNEHFGIAPVEMMAAGIVLVAHASGGPKEDIVAEGAGFLAASAQEYALAMDKVLDLYDDAGGDQCPELARIRDNALRSVQRFTQDKFVDAFKRFMRVLIPAT
jgi:alpha-1,2-mannosyltransferase